MSKKNRHITIRLDKKTMKKIDKAVQNNGNDRSKFIRNAAKSQAEKALTKGDKNDDNWTLVKVKKFIATQMPWIYDDDNFIILKEEK